MILQKGEERLGEIRFERIGTEELTKALNEASTLVVDARDANAYNGWRLAGERRGGHIPGARSIPAEWAGASFWDDVLKKKSLPEGRDIVVYGYDAARAERVAGALAAAGYGSIRIYADFADVWAADGGLPLERMSRFRTLVHPSWLRDALDGGEVEAPPGESLVVCHSHYRHPEDYHRGHVPGAVALSTLALEEPRMWNRRSPKELREALLAHGITADTTVVTYGRYSSPDNRDTFPGSNAGQIGAIRNAVIMMYAGVRDVRVLNGGLMAWEAAGMPVTTEPEGPKPGEDFGVEIPARPRLMVDLPEARKLLAADDGELVSVRSWREFIGEVSGYNYIDVSGRIPGAVFGDCGSDAYHMENFRNPDHTTREYGEVEANWLDSGITPDKRVAFYCGTGWRASEAFLNAWLLGWDDIAVFDGGWMEWSADPENPMETGVPGGEQGGGANR